MPLLEKEEETFVVLMRNSIREGLASVIGKSGTEAVFNTSKLNDNVMNPTATHAALLHIFKEHSTLILERAIMKDLFQRTGEHFVADVPFNYIEQFTLARKLFVAKQIRDQ
jgi:hypothetical protein